MILVALITFELACVELRWSRNSGAASGRASRVEFRQSI